MRFASIPLFLESSAWSNRALVSALLARQSDGMSWLRVFALAGLIALAGIGLGGMNNVAYAEGDASVQSWRVIQTAPRTAPAQQGQTYRARRRYDAPRQRFPDEAALGLIMPEITVAVPDPAEAARPKILLLGDSLADALAGGLLADVGIKAELAILPRTSSASGLVRDDYYDWPKTLREWLASTPDAAGIVIMVGLNDRQAIRQGETSLEPMTEAWQAQYRQRIDAMIGLAQQARVPLVWVGLPIMRSPRLSQDVASLNMLIRERVTQAGETFVETFDSFADGSGSFMATGPDVIGDTVRLRGPDGIHFTPAGQRKLAFFVEKPLRLRLGDRIQAVPASIPAPGSAAAQTGVPAEPSVALPKPPSPNTPERLLSLPPPEEALPPVLRQRPEIGEVRPLAVQNTATTLAGRQAPLIEDPVTRNLFERGIAPEPRAGRADDYRWR